VRSWIQGCREGNDQWGDQLVFGAEKTGARSIRSGHSSSAAISD